MDRTEADAYITLERKEFFAGLILNCLSQGVCRREELKKACSAAGMTELESESVFNSWGGTLRALAETGQITHKVGEDKAFQLCPPFVPMGEEAARLEMARRFFSMGPATVKDAAYFFGKPQREVRQWMERLPLTHARVDGRDCFWLDDGRMDWPDVPECLFLAGFDQLMLSYLKTESIFLPEEYIRGIFSLSGIVMAPILLRGKVAGRWKEKHGTLTLTTFGNWSGGDKKAALTAAEKLWTPKKVICAEK